MNYRYSLLLLALLVVLGACNSGGGADTTKPTVTLSPSANSFTAAGTLTLTATATDNVGIAKVEFFDGTTKLGEDTTSPYEQTVNLTAANNGSKSYTAKASDAAGNSETSAAVAVTVNIVGATGCPTPAVFDNPACTFDNATFGP